MARTLQEVQQELANLAYKLGIVQYQFDRELPREIEKLMNQMHDLDREGQKLKQKEADAQQEAVEKLKAQGDVVGISTAPTEVVSTPEETTLA